MKAFDEIIHQALREGMSVRFDPIDECSEGYTVTFSLGQTRSQARVPLYAFYEDRVNEIETLALIGAINRLRSYPYEEIYNRYFGKGENND